MTILHPHHLFTRGCEAPPTKCKQGGKESSGRSPAMFAESGGGGGDGARLSSRIEKRSIYMKEDDGDDWNETIQLKSRRKPEESDDALLPLNAPSFGCLIIWLRITTGYRHIRTDSTGQICMFIAHPIIATRRPSDGRLPSPVFV